MRLIDADALMNHKCDVYDYNDHLLYAVPTGHIINAPAIDAVEVVRCRDCKFYQPYDYHRKYDCSRGLLGVIGDDYCSYGERHEE